MTWGIMNMNWKSARAVALYGACFLATGTSFSPAAANMSRGVNNYHAVLAGTKQLKDLTPEEMQEVLAVYRALRPHPPTGSSEECRTAWDDAVSKADELQDRAKRLASCAANRDFDDDCDTEARHARAAQEDYESAASTVHSDCR